jgi:hypothetical protein
MIRLAPSGQVDLDFFYTAQRMQGTQNEILHKHW